MKDNIEVLLEDAGARWRSGQAPHDEPNWSRVTSRSKAPLWAAATAAVTALVVVLAVTFWPARTDEPSAHPLPVAGPLFPTAEGAIVPAPHVVQNSAPIRSYCPASALTGSLTFHSAVGELRLALHPGIDGRCGLPGMLVGSTALQIVDNNGRVLATAQDPRTRFSVNPPYFGQVALGPGYSATMYVRSTGGPPCLAAGSHAVVRYNGSEVQIPISGPAHCVNSAEQTALWYGPFSTPSQAVAFEPVDWTYISAALDFPGTIPSTGTVHFAVTLTNHSRTHAATLTPCPRFGMVLSSDKTVYEPQGAMQCSGKPVIVQPGYSQRFSLTYRLNVRPPAGDYAVGWAIAGVKTADAKTTVR